MEDLNNIELSGKMILHIVAIFGWFWLAAWTIIRVGFFKKRIFSLLMFIFFTQGVAETSALIASGFDLDCSQLSQELSSIFMMIGFFCLSNSLINLKDKTK